MPKRTNERQQIIELVKTLLAAPNCRVTASKMMRDAVTGIEREVDVVAEYDIEGDIFTQSIEVTALSRPVSLTRVEQLIHKHQTLPTDRLIIASWSGFTSSAVALAATTPRVALATPSRVTEPGGPLTLYVDTVTTTAKETRLLLLRPLNGDRVKVRVEHDHSLYTADKEWIGWAFQLAPRILGRKDVSSRLLEEAHHHPERQDLRSFVLAVPTEELGLYLHYEPTDELHQVLAVELRGGFRWEQKPLPLESREFMSQYFAHGTIDILGRQGLVVATLDDNFDIAKATVRLNLPSHLNTEQVNAGRLPAPR